MEASIPGEAWLERAVLQNLLDELAARNFETLGPVLRGGALTLERIRSLEDLPIGWRDTQSPGSYRVEATGSERIFDVLHGHGGLKRLTFAPREELLQIETEGVGRPFIARPTLPAPAKIAVLGVRACDLAALRIQDRVFLHDRYPDPYYASRREGLLLIAVSCTHSVSTCFCTSMGTGPEAKSGFDLALTELDGGFVARSGSDAGRELLAALPHRAAPAERLVEARRALDSCAAGRLRRRGQLGPAAQKGLFSRASQPGPRNRRIVCEVTQVQSPARRLVESRSRKDAGPGRASARPERRSHHPSKQTAIQGAGRNISRLVCPGGFGVPISTGW